MATNIYPEELVVCVYKAHQNNGIEVFIIVINASTALWLSAGNVLSIKGCTCMRDVPSTCKLIGNDTPFFRGGWTGDDFVLVLFYYGMADSSYYDIYGIMRSKGKSGKELIKHLWWYSQEVEEGCWILMSELRH